MSPTLNSVLEFLAHLFHNGIGYSGINTARSALSTFISVDGIVSLGKHDLVKRFMRGIFIMKPSLPRYNFTWNITDLLQYVGKLDNETLTLKQATFKLSALLALLTAQRLQSLLLIDIRNIVFSENIVKIRFGDLLKQSKPGKHISELVLDSYVDKNLCVVTCLKSYLHLKSKLRGKTENRLFISFVAPYKSVSKDTITRWIRTVMNSAGIDTGTFKPHSVRSASVSSVSNKLPLSTILKTAGWSNTCTFRKFYKKPVTMDTTYCNAILNSVEND